MCDVAILQTHSWPMSVYCNNTYMYIQSWAGTRVSLDTKGFVNSQCSSREVEDEIHFLFKCSIYEPDRKELIDIILTSYPNFNSLNDVKKLEWICNCENHNILTHLGVFFEKTLQIDMYFLYLSLSVCLFFLCFFPLMSCFSASDTKWNVTAIYVGHFQKHCPLVSVVEQQYIYIYIFVYYLTFEFCWGHEVECSMEHIHKHHPLVGCKTNRHLV